MTWPLVWSALPTTWPSAPWRFSDSTAALKKSSPHSVGSPPCHASTLCGMRYDSSSATIASRVASDIVLPRSPGSSAK